MEPKNQNDPHWILLSGNSQCSDIQLRLKCVELVPNAALTTQSVAKAAQEIYDFVTSKSPQTSS
jgi:hypothetical protein